MNDLSRTFSEVVSIIETARSNAFRKVNEELILMYMNVGRFLSENSKEQATAMDMFQPLPIIFSRSIPELRVLPAEGSIG